MNASQLKYEVESHNPESYFFDRRVMKAFGDTMSNYGVRKVTIRAMYDANGKYVGEQGEEIEAWELYRKRPVKAGNKESAYFRADNFRRVHPR